MKVGSLIYSCASGLGILGRDFVRHGIVTHPYVVRHAHHRHEDWHPGAPQGHIRSLDEREIQRHLAGCDVALFLETPFLWSLIPFCRENGIRTFLLTMYEVTPRVLPYVPDRFLCPSLLDLQYYPRGVFLPVPVDVPWRQHERAEVFVHNAGWGGLRGRNGTEDVLAAWQYVRSPARLIVRAQKYGHDSMQRNAAGGRLEVRHGTVPAESLYADADVFLFPERFNGLSLPLQEAFASGLACVAGARFPMTCWLPNQLLIPVHHYDRAAVSGRMNEFDEAVYRPEDIAAKIDEVFGTDISAYSLAGRAWAEENSWAALKGRYLEELSK